jgi:hypothetical protein
MHHPGRTGLYLTVPFGSQRASVTQTIGLTNISVTYDRPGVDGRKIWGRTGAVRLGVAGRANVNTVAFTSPVTINGKELPAGRYGSSCSRRPSNGR